MSGVGGEELGGCLIFGRKLAIKGAIFGGFGVGWEALFVVPPRHGLTSGQLHPAR